MWRYRERNKKGMRKGVATERENKGKVTKERKHDILGENAR